MWALIKALPLVGKIGAIFGAIALVSMAIMWSHHRGYEDGLSVSRAQIAEYVAKSEALQMKLDKAQTDVNIEVQKEYVDRIQYLDRIIEKTKTVTVDAVPQQYTLSSGWIAVFNGSVNGVEVPTNAASNSASSGVTDKEALRTLVENNGNFLANKAQLDALQDWVRKTEASRASITHSDAADTSGVQHTKTTRSNRRVSDTAGGADATK